MGPATAATVTGGAITDADTSATLSTGSLLLGSASTDGLAIANGTSLTIDGQTISFSSSVATTIPPSANGGTVSTSGTIQDLLNAIDAITGGTSSLTGGKLVIGSGTTQNLVINGTAAN